MLAMHCGFHIIKTVIKKNYLLRGLRCRRRSRFLFFKTKGCRPVMGSSLIFMLVAANTAANHLTAFRTTHCTISPRSFAYFGSHIMK